MAPVLKTHVLLLWALVNTWKLRKYLPMSGAKTDNCSKTVVVSGEVAEWLKAPVLKTGIRETVSGVRIPPSPPEISRSRLRPLAPGCSSSWKWDAIDFSDA
jgi:hypothetical protein